MSRIERHFGSTLSQINERWAITLSQNWRLSDPSFRRSALDFACDVMRGVKNCLIELAESLESSGYRFDERNPVSKPNGETDDLVNFLAKHGYALPLSVEAWLRVVGKVDFRGLHPKCEVLNSLDPLVVQVDLDYVQYLHSEWHECQRMNIDQCEPFRIDIAPDHLHKANISGGSPYMLDVDSLKFDTILLNERHNTTFFGYINAALRCSGFPGLDYADPGMIATEVLNPAFVGK